jgi:predicted membrane protein
MSNNSSNSGGIGFVGVLTTVFIVLKLLGKIDWSWVWILSPVWIAGSVAIFLILLVVVLNVIGK